MHNRALSAPESRAGIKCGGEVTSFVGVDHIVDINYILVKVANDEQVTDAGIILTPVNQERKYEGTVVDVGDNPDIKNFGIGIGNYVFYPKGLNKEIIIDDVVHDVVSVYDILAVGEEE